MIRCTIKMKIMNRIEENCYKKKQIAKTNKIYFKKTFYKIKNYYYQTKNKTKSAISTNI